MKSLYPSIALFALVCLATAYAETAKSSSESTVVVLGDSLSAGYQLAPELAWPSLLEELLQRDKYPYAIVNAGISGDTTDGGLSRLPGLLDKYQPVIVILELGANDGLRGQPLKKVRANLTRMITMIRASGAQPFLVGMQIPPNFGPLYADRFAGIYRDMQREQEVPWMPFLLGSIAEQPDYFLADGLHPNPAGHRLVAEDVYAALRKALPQHFSNPGAEREMRPVSE